MCRPRTDFTSLVRPEPVSSFRPPWEEAGSCIELGCPGSVVLMKDVQRIAIVDPSDSTREPLRNLLLGVESVWLEAEGSRYEFFQDVVRQSDPDVAVVALDADHTKALQLIGQLATDHPGLPILAVSARGDGQSILQALRSGAKEFLTQPVVLEELLTALQRLRRTRGGGDGTGTPGALN